MANITKLEFTALDISGSNYLSWILDAEIYMISKGLGEIIKEKNTQSQRDRATALIFLRHHLHEGLKGEYLTVKDPEDLWKKLAERFDHQKTIVLPRARYEWMHLRLQDFKIVGECNSELFIICSKLILCGEKITNQDMLEKTFSTFHTSNVLLQQQYRERGFKKYSELISCLLVAEQNNELLMKNRALRPTGSVALLEANAVHLPEANATSYERGRRRGRGCNHGRGRGYGQNNGSNNRQDSSFKKRKMNENNSSKKNDGEICYICGMTGHWSLTCRTAKHLVDLYQQSIKGKGKVETNFADIDSPNDMTHLDVSDFLIESSEKLVGGDMMDQLD